MADHKKGGITMRRKKEAEERRKQAEESFYRLLEDPDFREMVAYYDELFEKTGLTAEDILEHAIEIATENRKEHKFKFVFTRKGAKNEKSDIR